MITVLNQEMTDYLQAKEYEYRAHKFLIGFANNHNLTKRPVYQQWLEECQEACVQFECARNTLNELYPDGWRTPEKEDVETFANQLIRLFPNKSRDPMHIGGAHCKDVTIQVTEECNMACTYCYQGHKTCNSMDFDTAKKFIDWLLEGKDPYINADNSDGIILDFIGGEPFLKIGLIRKTAEYFVTRAFELHHRFATRFMFSITSNGLLYFEPEVQEFFDEYQIHTSFSITIDGNKQLHDTCRLDKGGYGTYDRAIAAVDHFVNVRHGNMGSKMTIAPANVGYVYEAAKNMIDYGYKHIFLNCVYEEGWTVEHARTLYKQLCQLADYLVTLDNRPTLSIFDKKCGHPLPESENQNWCGGNGLMLAVDYHGDLYYMPSSVGPDVEPFTIGDIEHGVCNKERLHCLSCVTRCSQSSDECIHCPIASGCSWCTAYNYQIFGTPNKRATFICPMHKARVLANEYYWNLVGDDYEVDMPEEWRKEIVDV
jgi:radical SAM peptide maturase (CXXX-repeat target family)